jgi:hypothetical protein
MKRLLALTILLPLGTVGGVLPQEPRPFQVSVSVDLVVLNATVRDQKGNAVTGLREEDFDVYEDGVKQAIRLFRHEDIPVTVGLVVDHSGSMRQKLPHVIAAARTFVQSSSPADQMFVVNFNEKVTLGLPAAIPFTNRPEDLAHAISDTPTAGMTALYDAIFTAQERLVRGSRDKKVLMVISDGGDNASAHTLVDVLESRRAIRHSRVHDRYLRAGRSGPESGCAQTPGAGVRRRSLLPGRVRRRSGGVRAHCARHPQSVHIGIRVEHRAAGGVSHGESSRARSREEKAAGAHAIRIFR